MLETVTAALIPLAGLAGWWLRGGLQKPSHPTPINMSSSVVVHTD